MTLVASFVAVVLVAPAAASAASGPTPMPTVSPTPSTTTTQCGGRLTFGRIVTCPSIVDAAQQIYRFTTTQDNDQIYIDLTRGTGTSITGRLADATGTYLCGAGFAVSTCTVGAAGTYTLTVTTISGSGTGNYQLSVESLLTPSRCRTLPPSFFSWASTGVTATLPAGAAAQCYAFDQPTGALLFLADPGGAGDVQGEIIDAQNQGVCPVRDTNQCTLTGTGPYRLFLYESNGQLSTYNLRMPRISQSVGCQLVKASAFGAAGGASVTGSVTYTQQATCAKVRVSGAGSIGVRFDNSQNLSWTLYDPAGTKVCDQYSNGRACPVPAVGDYTLVIRDNGFFGDSLAFTLAVTAQFRDVGCATGTATAWDQAALVVHQTAGVQTNCQPFHGNAGDRVVWYSAPTVYNNVSAWLVDATGKPLCSGIFDGQDGCVLPATGTYRILSFLSTWNPQQDTDLTYLLQVRRLNAPAGCPVIRPAAYGTDPGLGNNRCRVLNIPAAGKYIVSPVDASNYQSYGQVYDASGTKVCTSNYCDFPAAGRYTMVLNGSSPDSVIDTDFQYAVALLPVQAAHCGSVSDAASPVVPASDTLAPGQYDCLQLPSAAGTNIAELLPGSASGTANPTVTVFDSLGTYLCDNSYQLRQIACTLSGTGPFHAVVTAASGAAPGPYTLGFARVDGPPTCQSLPHTAAGATVTTSPGHFAMCFSAAAGATEAYTFTRTSGTGNATIEVFDAAGTRYCGSYQPLDTDTLTCTMPAGPVTVFLQSDNVAATYQVTYKEP